MDEDFKRIDEENRKDLIALIVSMVLTSIILIGGLTLVLIFA